MWEISNYNQIVSFLISLCFGIAFCIIYDVVRALRKVCLNSFFAVTVTDISVWIFYAVATFILLISRTNGEIRSYVLIGEGIGFFLFRITLSKFLVSILQFVFVKAAKVLCKIRAITSQIYTVFEKFLLKIRKVISIFFKSIKKLLKNTFKLLYTNKNIADSERMSDETKTKA